MTTRNATKPTATERYWPHFAQGWDGRETTAIPCADCGMGAYVGLGQRDPRGANVAHVVAAEQRWDGNVVVTCRACNDAHRTEGDPTHLVGLVRTREAVEASRAYVAEARRAVGAETEARARARRARRP